MKASEHILSGFSITAISSFSSIENKHDVCRGKDRKKKLVLKSARNEGNQVLKKVAGII